MSSVKTKVLLRTDVPHLGDAGAVKDVARGFARNYLFPRGLAIQATSAAVEAWSKKQAAMAKAREEKIKNAQALSQKLASVSLSFAKTANDEGLLFGSVGKGDILKSLKACGYAVAKEEIVLPSALKKTGDYEIEINLAPSVTAKIKLAIGAKPA